MRPGVVLLPRKDVILMALYVSVQSKYIPPCQWYLHNNASYPHPLQWWTSMAGQRFAFAPVAGENLVGLQTPRIAFSPKNKLKHWLIWPQQTFSLCSRPSEMSSGPENSPGFEHWTGVKLYPCVTEIQVAFLDAASDYQWKWFSRLLLSTCGCIWQSSMMVSCAMPSEGSKVKHIQQRSTPLPNTEISLDSLNLVTILWKVWKA